MTGIGFDTSVLVAALVEPHPRHHRALPWLTGLAGSGVGGYCSTHALAETWAVLSRLPIDPPISPPAARSAVQRIERLLEVLELTTDDYEQALSRCSERNLKSGVVFDALHLVRAERAGLEALVTFNPADFERLLSDTSPRIVVPPDPPAFEPA